MSAKILELRPMDIDTDYRARVRRMLENDRRSIAVEQGLRENYRRLLLTGFTLGASIASIFWALIFVGVM